MAVAFATFVKALQQLPLLDVTQCEQLAGLQQQFPELKGLAQELVRRRWLTNFQANQVAAGKGFTLILDQYVLLHLLGEGGMGAVYKARQQRAAGEVAVKLIRREALKSPGALERFQREAKIAAKLSHPNVVTLLDQNTANGVPFLVMELIDGTDLAKLVEKQGPLPVTHACNCIRQAALGLQHAHEHHLVHRDIKPQNLMLSKQGQVKVMDLGLARTAHAAAEKSASAGLTATGAIIGTLDYLAPEQAMDAKRADIRADIYSLGCTLYHLLAGEPPFPGGTAANKITAHLFAELPSLTAARSDVPAALDAVVRRMMAKEPGQRYQTPAEVAQALGPFAGSGSANVTPTLASSPRLSSPSTAETIGYVRPSEPPTQLQRPRRRLSLLVPLVAVVLIGLGALLTWALLRFTPTSEPLDRDEKKAPLALNLGGGVNLELVRITHGNFRMGSPGTDKDADDDEKPEHDVTISKDFLLGKFAVTRGQFAQFVKDDGYRTEAETDATGGWGYDPAKNEFASGKKYSWRDTGFAQDDNHPVVNVTWNDSPKILSWASKKTGQRVELPREAEWEYACRAGKTTRYFTGDASDSLGGYANVADQTLKAKRIKGSENWTYFDFKDDFAFTAPVGSFKPNPWKLCDMTGNVWQWCADGKRTYEEDKCTDPIGPNDDSARVLRGGSWNRSPRNCRCAFRSWLAASDRSSDFGFRVLVRLD